MLLSQFGIEAGEATHLHRNELLVPPMLCWARAYRASRALSCNVLCLVWRHLWIEDEAVNAKRDETMTNADAVAAVTKLVGTYVEAMTRGDRGELERLFFEAASEVGHYKGELLWNSRDAFIRMCEDEGDTSLKPDWVIRSLSIHGDIAMVHVQNDWAGMRFDDLLTLLHHEGAWRIVSKVYHIRD